MKKWKMKMNKTIIKPITTLSSSSSIDALSSWLLASSSENDDSDDETLNSHEKIKAKIKNINN